MGELVSVIIPVYNKENYLENSIQSVLNQKYKNIEIIVIDDGSTDTSKDIILNYQIKDSRIQYIYQTNSGVSKARNLGIEQAKGKYICFLDADDLYTNDFIEELIVNIKEKNISYCGHYNVTKNGELIQPRFRFKHGDILKDYFLNSTTPNTNSWMIKLDLILDNGIRFRNDLDWGEDMLFFAELLMIEKNVVAVPKFLTRYSVEVENSLSKNDINKISKDILWLELALSLLEKKEDNINRIKEIKNAILGYRLPASVVYRLINNNIFITNEEMNRYFKKYRNYIKNQRLVNGMRSIKLYIYSIKLRLLIKKCA